MDYLEALVAKGVPVEHGGADPADAAAAGARADHPDGAAGRPADRARADVRATARRWRCWPAASARTGCCGRSCSWRPWPAAAHLYVMIRAIPDANQTYRQLVYDVVSQQVENDVRPQVFFDELPELGPLHPRHPARRRRLEGRPGRRHRPAGRRRPRSTWRTAAGWSWTARSRPWTWSSRTAPDTRSRGADGKAVDTYRFPNELIVTARSRRAVFHDSAKLHARPQRADHPGPAGAGRGRSSPTTSPPTRR